MFRITNLTNRPIDITSNISINARSYLDVQTSITSRLHQLMNVGVIKIQEIKEKTDNSINSSDISEGSLRRKQMMEKIRNGDIKPGVSLDVSSYKQINTTSKSKKEKSKKINK